MAFRRGSQSVELLRSLITTVGVNTGRGVGIIAIMFLLFFFTLSKARRSYWWTPYTEIPHLASRAKGLFTS